MAEKTHACTVEWRGIMLAVSFDPAWMQWEGGPLAHLEVTTIAPEREPLPITETGYRSHFCDPEEVDAAGGPGPYVLHWLDDAALSMAWKKRDAARRQLSLF